MHFECRTSAVRLLPEYRPKSGWKVPPMMYEFTSNAVRTLPEVAAECGSNVQEFKQNAARILRMYFECT